MHHNSVLPQDILASVVDVVATQGDNTVTATLRNLSLACKTLVPLCRQHLFSSFHLSSSFTQTAERFSNLLRSNPDIASYLKVFKCEFSVRGISEHGERIIRVLHEKTPALRSIHLEFVDNFTFPRLDWDSLRPDTTRLYLESLIRLPTIASVNLTSISNFPISLLSMCTGLTGFELKKVTAVSSYEVPGILTRTKIPAPLYLEVSELGSCTALGPLNPGAEERLIDFSHLQEAKIEIFSSTDVEITKSIVNASNCLCVFELDVDQYLSLESLEAGFVANRRTLQEIKLNVGLGNNEPHPLCGLNHLLRSLSVPGGSDTGSVLEQLNISIYLNTNSRLNTESRDWEEFDRVLTRPTAFPRLKGVDIYISWTSTFDGERDYDVEEVLGQLTEERFSGLSETETISFSFFQEHEWC